MCKVGCRFFFLLSFSWSLRAFARLGNYTLVRNYVCFCLEMVNLTTIFRDSSFVIMVIHYW